MYSGGKIPDVSYFRVFGCKAYVHILKDARQNKLQPKAKVMVFVGYEPGSKGYKFWDKDSRSIVVSRDVTFDEKSFPNKEPRVDPRVAPEANAPVRNPTPEPDFDPEAVLPEIFPPDEAQRPRPDSAPSDDSDLEDMYQDPPQNPPQAPDHVAVL